MHGHFGYGFVALLALLPPLAATTARAEGPWVHANFDAQGAFRSYDGSVDVDASADFVWAILVDYSGYPSWNERITQTRAQTEKDGSVLLTHRLGGGLFADTVTFRVLVDTAARTLDAKYEKGALAGTRFRYAVTPRAEGGCVVRVSGVTLNFSSALAFDDEFHSLLIGVNLAEAHEDLRHLKLASEARAARPPLIPHPVAGPPSGTP